MGKEYFLQKGLLFSCLLVYESGAVGEKDEEGETWRENWPDSRGVLSNLCNLG